MDKESVARIFIASREQPDIAADDTVIVTDSVDYKFVDIKKAFSVGEDGDKVVMDRVREVDTNTV